MQRFEMDEAFGAMRAAVRGKRVIPIIRALAGHDADDVGEVLHRLPLPSSAASWAIHILYRNAAGEETERTITCKRMVSNLGGSVTVLAYCHLREQPRCFTIDNMLEAVDLSTGEFVDPTQHFRQLMDEGLPFVNQGMATFARICTFLSRCDGHEHPAEWREIEHGLERYALRFGGDDHDLEHSLSLCRALAPDDQDFVKSVSAFRRAPNGPKLASLAIETCARIIDADGRHADEEITWGGHVGDVLKRIAMRST